MFVNNECDIFRHNNGMMYELRYELIETRTAVDMKNWKQEVHLNASFINSLFLLMKCIGGYQLRGDLIIRYPLFSLLLQDVVSHVYLLEMGMDLNHSIINNSS